MAGNTTYYICLLFLLGIGTEAMVEIQTIKQGDNMTFAEDGDQVTVHYTGQLVDLQEFDSSRGPNRSPFSFTVGRGEVINGWDIGMKHLSKGEKARLIITYNDAYGNQTVDGQVVIHPYATLLFTVDMLDVKKANPVNPIGPNHLQIGPDQSQQSNSIQGSQSQVNAMQNGFPGGANALQQNPGAGPLSPTERLLALRQQQMQMLRQQQLQQLQLQQRRQQTTQRRQQQPAQQRQQAPTQQRQQPTAQQRQQQRTQWQRPNGFGQVGFRQPVPMTGFRGFQG